MALGASKTSVEVRGLQGLSGWVRDYKAFVFVWLLIFGPRKEPTFQLEGFYGPGVGESEMDAKGVIRGYYCGLRPQLFISCTPQTPSKIPYRPRRDSRRPPKVTLQAPSWATEELINNKVLLGSAA